MSRVLSDDDIEAICHRLTAFSGLTPEEHRDHHNAFAEYIASQRRKAEFYDKVKQQVGGWAIITVLSAIGYASWHTFVTLISRGA